METEYGGLWGDCHIGNFFFFFFSFLLVEARRWKKANGWMDEWVCECCVHIA